MIAHGLGQAGEMSESTSGASDHDRYLNKMKAAIAAIPAAKAKTRAEHQCPRMSRPPMPNRVLRVGDQLWKAAQEKAAERDENLSEEIRKFLTRYSRR